jgi:hypothetical protein
MTAGRPPFVDVICSGRGAHEPTTLRIKSRYHVWDHKTGKARTDPASAAWPGAPADQFTYVVVCRACRKAGMPWRRAFTPEQYEQAAAVSITLDISYID